MTDIAEMEDTELEEHLEDSRVCTPWSTVCGVEATWLAVATCCGFEMPLCSEHKRLHELEIILMAAVFVVVDCKLCEKTFDLDTEHPIEYVRIK